MMRLMEITNQSIKSYLTTISKDRLPDMVWLIDQMTKVTKTKPKLWGSIVGFGKLYYRYPTGHDGYMPILGLANRKQAITLYLSLNIQANPLLKKLGKYQRGKSCLYLRSLEGVDLNILKTLIIEGYQETVAYPFVKVIG